MPLVKGKKASSRKGFSENVKFLKVSRKSKPLLSLIPKRVGGKKLLPKKKPTRKQPSNG